MRAMKGRKMRRVLEAVLFVADEPLPVQDLAALLEEPASAIEEELLKMAADYEASERGIVLRNVAGGWRFSTDPSAAEFLERFVVENRYPRLTQAALETLAIVAYRQPVSRAQIAEIRGVSAESVIRTLVARGLIEEVGRDSGPGNAILYGTTTAFLERMGLKSLAELPLLPEYMPGTEAVERMEAGLGPGL